MTKRREVLDALKAMLVAALPSSVTVEGLDGADASPDRLLAGGRVLIEAGNPGEPEIDLSPPTYNYRHEIPVTVDALAVAATADAPAMTAEDAVDAILDLMSAAIEADRFLGGAVDYLDAYAPQSEDDYVDGAAVSRVAPFTIIATYSTSHPL